jgi:hypothetical protein
VENNLLEIFESKLNEIRTLIDANDKAYDQRFVSSREATQLALSSAERAVTKAEVANEKRLDSVNEFRQTLSDQQKNLITRKEVDLMNKNIIDKISKVEEALVRLEGTKTGINQGWGWAVAGISLIIMVYTLIEKFAK